MKNFKIRTCTKEDIGFLAEIIRISFRDVAKRFELTSENAPRHPSNCTEHWIKDDLERGATYFALKNEGRIVGCAACEQANSTTCYLERLAVLPHHRKQGFGKALVEHILSEARKSGADCVNIGIISEHTDLKGWYKRIGFVEKETKVFPHLPFKVTFMSYKL